MCIFDFQNGGRPPSWIWCDIISDQPRLAGLFDGPNTVLKLHVDRVYTLQDIAIFILVGSAWNCQITPFFGVFWGILPPYEFNIVDTPKGTTSYEPQLTVKFRPRVRLGLVPESKTYSITRKTVTIKKCRNNSPIWGEAPAEWIEMKICTGVELRNIIMDVTFIFENFQEFFFYVIGGQNSPFPNDFARGPYHSAAIPRCLWYSHSVP